MNKQRERALKLQVQYHKLVLLFLYYKKLLAREIRIVESLFPIWLSRSFHTSFDWFDHHPDNGPIVHREILQIVPIVQQFLTVFTLQAILAPHKLPRYAGFVSLGKLVEEEVANR